MVVTVLTELGELIPLVEPGGPPIRHTIVVAGHVSPDEIPWGVIVEELHFYPEDCGADSIDELAEILASEAPPDGDRYSFRHTYAKGRESDRHNLEQTFVADVDEDDGHPVTVLEE